MSSQGELNRLRERLHKVIVKEYGPNELSPMLAMIMHGDDVGNERIMKAVDEYQAYLKSHYREIYPNLGK